MKKALFVLILFASSIFVSAQSFNGFALYNSQGSNTTYLIDENENIAHTWNMNSECNYAVSLKKNGNLVRGTKVSTNVFSNGNIAASGGRVQMCSQKELCSPSGKFCAPFFVSTPVLLPSAFPAKGQPIGAT